MIFRTTATAASLRRPAAGHTSMIALIFPLLLLLCPTSNSNNHAGGGIMRIVVSSTTAVTSLMVEHQVPLDEEEEEGAAEGAAGLGGNEKNDDKKLKLQSSQTWNQLGNGLSGSLSGGCTTTTYGYKLWSGDYFGSKVSISGDGSVLAVGAPNYDHGTNAETDDRGGIWVYQFANNAWTTLGGPIVGEAAGDRLGYYFSLSSDGKVLADGTPSKSNNAGRVRVYQFANNAWTRLGGDIDGKAAEDRSGMTSISLSSNGKVLAVGAMGNDPSGRIDAGHVRVYQYVNNVWTRLGGDIDGKAAGDGSGSSISLSSNGEVLAVGASGNDPSGRIDAGHVRVYQYVNNVWTQLGNDIDGTTAGDMSGSSVTLSNNGSILAVGAPGLGVQGHVRVYQYKADSGSWVQQGGTFQTVGTISSHSLSGDGNVLAVGERDFPTDFLYNVGRVRVYRYVNSAWNQLGTDIIGVGAYNYFGRSVSLSSNGSVLAGGAPSNKALYYSNCPFSKIDDAGQARVYQNNFPSVSTAPTTRSPTWHPTMNQLTSKPTTRIPTTNPTSNNQQPTRKPTAKPTSNNQQPTRKPSTKSPTLKPTKAVPTLKPTVAVARVTLQTPICAVCYQFYGNMFDVKAKRYVSIKSLTMVIQTGAVAEVWTRVGTHVGFEDALAGWTKVAEHDFTTTLPGTFATIPESSFSQPINIPTGSTQALYITLRGADLGGIDGMVYMSKSDNPTSAISIEDNNLIIYAGIANRYFFREYFVGYNWNGALIYAL